MFGPRNSAYAVNLTYETYRHTYIHIYIYISREISIEHPSVGLASLAQLLVERISVFWNYDSEGKPQVNPEILNHAHLCIGFGLLQASINSFTYNGFKCK